MMLGKLSETALVAIDEGSRSDLGSIREGSDVLDDDDEDLENSHSGGTRKHDKNSIGPASLREGSVTCSSGLDDNNSNNNNNNNASNLAEELTKGKTKVVNRFRACVMVVLIIAAIGVSVTVFLLSRRADVAAFLIQYEGSVDKIISAFQAIPNQNFKAIAALANDVTQFSTDSNTAWPFFTISNFEGRAANARSLSRALSISISHSINDTSLQKWEKYVLKEENNYWIDDGHTHQRRVGIDDFESLENIERSRISDYKVDPVHFFDTQGIPSTNIGDGPYLVRWQTSPVLKTSFVNVDLFHHDFFQMHCATTILNTTSRLECPNLSYHSFKSQAAVLGGLYFAEPGSPSHLDDPLTSYYATLQSMYEEKQVNYLSDPMSFLFMPIFDKNSENNVEKPNNNNITGERSVVAVMEAVIHWKAFFTDILPSNLRGVTVVLSNPCDGAFTYEIQGSKIFGVGFGDLHDPKYDYLEREAQFNLTTIEDGTYEGIKWDDLGCPFSIRIYPTDKYYDRFVSSAPINVTFAVGMVFFYTIILFIFYDRLVETRQQLILSKAMKSTAIVTSLFPKSIADQMLAEPATSKKKSFFGHTAKLKNFLGNNGDLSAQNGDSAVDSQPIADLFPHCTILFADIAGFTAWSSTREPALVFKLLQTIYQSFDRLAKTRKVFKVETIGDCYVAVTGLPEAQPNHAIIMAQFASSCSRMLHKVTRNLEVSLGPGTADLGMRFGLHSGPVTAGVLRGDRARFQLFGDTVNTAARMESTGQPNRIQCSQSTASYLKKSGKEHWLKARKDMVEAKGKGVLQTFWVVVPLRKRTKSVVSSSGKSDRSAASTSSSNFENIPSRRDNLVDWVATVFQDYIEQILSKREASGNGFKSPEVEDVTYKPDKGDSMQEVVEAISLPQFDADANVAMMSSIESGDRIQVSATIVSQLKKYVSIIASRYNQNSFHNFEHACHVTMTTNKLLKRIVAPEIDEVEDNQIASQLHDYTHGINSDPLTLFAIVFSALIHDVDHRGVSNAQLAKEDEQMAECYKNKSVAEQNSLDLSWDLFMEDDFIELRQCLFLDQDELRRFRQVVVNVVLATDIFDKELNDLRKIRWQKAFSLEDGFGGESHDDLRATIVLEHIIQASDVSHTMQHWHVYRKWNTCLFKEMMHAYRSGRMGKSPEEFWYNGELGFFDNYIIPLAGKLKECNVFGVSSDECLNYAISNRAEWEERGQAIIKEMMEDLNVDLIDQLEIGQIEE